MSSPPVAWLLGVKWNDCTAVGNLLGTRLILNEFVAFVDLGKIGSMLDPKSFVIATYALCGLRKPQFGSDSSRRIGRAGADPQIGRGPPRHEGSGRGNHGQLHVGLHRGYVVMSPVGIVLGSGLGRSGIP